jgi:5-methyltetrahydropteroyltriglutamate--homocysteine methyltransferase
MQRSTDRILTTHVGSLIRPDALLAYIRPLQAGQPYDAAAYASCLKSSVADIVRRQAEAGIDIVSDGEFGKSISWSQYALERLSGFEKRPLPADSNPFAQGADRERFSEFYEELDGKQQYATVNQAVCTAPIEYTGLAEVERDIANFKAALAQADVTEGFLPVAAPSSVIPDRHNEFYASEDDCLEAIGKSMRVE